ncbi:MAG: diacylglycerol kinase [Betaproteobacteria bacterium]|nr:diacylglycerol kinase [Betaproteobacteria bacterium]
MAQQNSSNQNGAPNVLQSTLSVARIFNAFKYSMNGFSAAFRHEAAFRQELLFAVPACCVLWFLPVTPVEKVLLLTSALLVLIVELLNSAVEAVVDRVSEERHPLSGRAKDFGSAAVLLSLVIMGATWILIAGPVLMRFFK